MDTASFVSQLSIKTPPGWRLTWEGDDHSLSAQDEDGLVVFASIPEILFSTSAGEDVLITSILEATEERIEWCRSWGILQDRAFVTIRPLEAFYDPAYKNHSLWIGGELAALLSASLDSHTTLLPDATLKRLGVPMGTLWTQAVKNLERWFRGRTWEISGPQRQFVSLEDDPVYLVTDPEQKASSLVSQPRLIAEIAAELAIYPVCFAVPSEGTLLIGKDTPAGRFAVTSTANVMSYISKREQVAIPLSTEVFRIGADNGPVSTQIIH